MPRKSNRAAATFRRVAPIDPSVPMTTEQVADFLCCSQKKVYRLVDAGKLPAVKVGQTLLFSPRKIFALVDMEDCLSKDTPIL